jgi:hypothetical protein
LNVVWLGVSMCHQANLCHKISTHQIVVTSSIDDDANAAIIGDEENLEKVMSLKLLGLIHVGTQDLLHDIGLGAVPDHMLTPKDLFVITVIR